MTTRHRHAAGYDADCGFLNCETTHLRALFASVCRMSRTLNDLFGLRAALAIVFFWFGVLKFFPGLSPAEELCARTTSLITFGLIPPNVAVPMVAALECLIAIGLLRRKWLGGTLVMLLGHMMATALPLVFFREETFAHFPYGLTLEGQYIVKNLVLIAAALTLARAVPMPFASTLRGRTSSDVPRTAPSEAAQ